MQGHFRLFSLQEILIIVRLFYMIMLEAYKVDTRLQHGRSTFTGTSAWNLSFFMCVRASRVTHREIIMAVQKDIDYLGARTNFSNCMNCPRRCPDPDRTDTSQVM